MTARFSIGIDLGTTNSVVAYAELAGEQPSVKVLEIPQLVAAGQIERRNGLPSFLYLPPTDEAETINAGQLGSFPGVVGEMARQQAALSPKRVVAAAKSWLCHHRVNRHDAILPWQAPEDVSRVSPVTASARYLQHLVAVWNDQFPDSPLADQFVVLTVPASFDPAARELTREAAFLAGLPADFLMLEEPQAAVYRWLAAKGEHWRRELAKDDRLLVVDVGGGTTDLTLVSVSEDAGRLELRRSAVGNHLLVGGDNMDLALAHAVSVKLQAAGHSLDPWQSVSLWHACRLAKESLLREGGPEKQTISVLGRSTRLIGGTLSAELSVDEVSQLLVDGFMPVVSLKDRPQRQWSSGFQDLGLPYESDPAITRHLAAFLAAQPDGIPRTPTHLLLNGGVLRSARLQQRLHEVLKNWADQSSVAPPKVLGGIDDLDNAVALGAAYYGWTKLRGGVRIRGGTARSFYLGIEVAGLAIPGAPRPLKALCVAPQGMEEGSELDVPGGEVGLVVGEPARFRFFAAAQRKQDQVGAVIDPWMSDELQETTPIELTLPAQRESSEPFVPVRFHSRVTELGIFELWCRSTRDDQQWKLEFNARDE